MAKHSQKRSNFVDIMWQQERKKKLNDIKICFNKNGTERRLNTVRHILDKDVYFKIMTELK